MATLLPFKRALVPSNVSSGGGRHEGLSCRGTFASSPGPRSSSFSLSCFANTGNRNGRGADLFLSAGGCSRTRTPPFNLVHSSARLNSVGTLRRSRSSLVKPRAKVESKELEELDSDWESETRPGIFTRLVIAVSIALAAVSGGTLLLRIVASIFAIFLACIRYIFISVVLLFILSLLWS